MLNGDLIDEYYKAFTSWSLPKSCAKVTQIVENSKCLLKNLKLDKTLTLSQAFEKKDITIRSVCGIASSNKSIDQLNVKSEPSLETNLTTDESEINSTSLILI